MGYRLSRKAGFRHFVPQPATGNRSETIAGLHDCNIARLYKTSFLYLC
jgi:hypothetical protein